MSDLVKSILSEDYVSASQIFESRLDDIMEMKLIEMKKYIQAEGILRLGLTKDEIEARKRLGWKKASDVLPDPRDFRLSSIHSAHPSGAKKKPATKHKRKLKEGSMIEPKGEPSPAVSTIMKKLKSDEHPGIEASKASPADMSPVLFKKPDEKLMSPQLRRATLEKARKEKIASSTGFQKLRLMKKGEIAKTAAKKSAAGLGKSSIGVVQRALQGLAMNEENA